MHSNGTPEAISFIKKYKKTGYIVDFYSDDYISSRESNRRPISKTYLKSLDAEFGTDYRGHLLIFYIRAFTMEMNQELSRIYEPINHYLSLDAIAPSFLVVNLVTQEILCVGIGRKNQEFHFELHNYLRKHTTKEEPNVVQHFSLPEISVHCSEEFFELDYFDVSKKIIKEMDSLGNAYYDNSIRNILKSIKGLSNFASIEDKWELKHEF